MKRLVWLSCLLALTTPLTAKASDARTAAAHAIAQASAQIKLAAHLNDQWPATLSAFKSAQSAQAKGDYAQAQSKALTAQTLATLSIRQARAQKKLWTNEVVK